MMCYQRGCLQSILGRSQHQEDLRRADDLSAIGFQFSVYITKGLWYLSQALGFL